MKKSIFFGLVCLANTAFAEDPVEKIYQSLLKNKSAVYEKLEAAANGDVQKADLIAGNDVFEFCTNSDIYKSLESKQVKLCEDVNDPKRKELHVHFAKIRFQTEKDYLRKLASGIAQINKLAEECKSGTGKIFEQEYTSACQEKVVCSGDLAAKIEALTKDNFQSLLSSSSRRELQDNERVFDGIDLSPVLNKDSNTALKIRSGQSLFQIVPSATKQSVNMEYYKKLDKKMNELLRKIERNPKGFSQLMKGDDGFESIEEFKEMLAKANEVKDPKMIAELLNMAADDEDEEDEKKIDEKAVKKYIENVKVAGDQISEMEVEMAKFYKENQGIIQNPVVKSSSYASAINSTIPDGIMTIRGVFCENKSLKIGETEKQNDRSCEIIFGNTQEQKYVLKKFDGSKVSRVAVEHKCTKKSPLSFFSKLFGKKSETATSINDGDRSTKEVTPAVQKTIENKSGALQQ